MKTMERLSVLLRNQDEPPIESRPGNSEDLYKAAGTPGATNQPDKGGADEIRWS